MSFDDFAFWVFVLAVWAACWVARSNIVRIAILIAASYIFYATWNPVYLLFLAGYTILSFFIGRAVQKGTRQFLMLAGVAICVGALVYAKGWMSPLPVGISFYALQAIAYIVDSYRGDLAKPAGLFDYTLYMSFFPRLTAGPIVRAGEFLPQLARRPRIGSAEIWEALVLITFGLFKKLVIADNLAAAVNPVFSDFDVSSSRILLATYGFAAQIYCDFSGYTDIALGVARLFGYKLPENFNWPYLSKNPPDFWRRWHISFSNWLRDNVYFSLPGHRSKARIFSYVNIMITMLICGIWHGLGSTFLLWGLYHGILLVAYYAIRPRRRTPEQKLSVSGMASILVMQQFSVIGWILFRINRLSDVPAYVGNLFHAKFFNGFSSAEWMAVALIALMVLAHLIELVVPITKTVLANRWNPWILTGVLLTLLTTAILSVPKQQLFLYFRF